MGVDRNRTSSAETKVVFVGSFQALLEDATGFEAYLHFRHIADKRVDVLCVTHTSTLASICAAFDLANKVN